MENNVIYQVICEYANENCNGVIVKTFSDIEKAKEHLKFEFDTILAHCTIPDKCFSYKGMSAYIYRDGFYDEYHYDWRIEKQEVE